MEDTKRDITNTSKNEKKQFIGNKLFSAIIDNNRMSGIRKNESDTEKLQMALKLSNDLKKLEAIDYIESEENKVTLALSIMQDETKLKAIEKLNEEKNILTVALTLKSDKQKSQAMQCLSKEESKLELALTIQDAEMKKEYVETFVKEENSVEITTNLRYDKDKLEMTDYFQKEEDRAKIATSLEDEEQKFEFINSLEDENCKATVAASLEGMEQKEGIVESLEDISAKAVVVASYSSDEKKIEFINSCEDEHANALVVASFQNAEQKIQFIQRFKDENDILLIAESIKDDGQKIKLIKFLDFVETKVKIDIAKQLSDEGKLNAIDLLKEDYDKISLAVAIEDDNLKIKAISKLESSVYISSITDSIKDSSIREQIRNEKDIIYNLANKSDEEKIEQLKYIKVSTNQLEVIDMIYDKNKRLEYLMTIADPEICTMYRTRSEDTEFIKDNIEFFAKKECPDIEFSKEIIEELYEKNNSIIHTINFKLLDEKYIELFGKDKINQIGCYQDAQNKLLGLDDKKCELLAKCIDNHEKNMETEQWTGIANKILTNLDRGDYDGLISGLDLENIEKEDLDLLNQRLQEKNIFNISDLDGIRNFEQVCEQEGGKLLESNVSIEIKRELVMQKIFGHSFAYAQEIVEKYGLESEKIQDEDLKNYVECLRELISLDDEEILKESFEACDFYGKDKSIVTRQLKNEYGKSYNEGLYEPKQEELIDEEFNIYEAGTDFKMIMTAVGSFCKVNAANYKDDWNRAEISTQHVCTSYIRNDMIGTAPISSICYGFSEMEPDALMAAGEDDIFSDYNKFDLDTRADRYYFSDGLVNNTTRYNELDYNRFQNGEKKQPDYILVFKEDGQIPNMEEAKKASRDWGGLPIVVVDKDKCLASERQKVENMLEEYSQNPNEELAKQIRQKVRNNRVTNVEFCQDIENELPNIDIELEMNHENQLEINEEPVINDSELNEEKEPATQSGITEESLEEIYDQTSATDRKRSASRMKDLYRQISEIARGEHDEK